MNGKAYQNLPAVLARNATRHKRKQVVGPVHIKAASANARQALTA